MTEVALNASTTSRPATAPPRWEGTAACATVADSEQFFPLDEDGPAAAPARAVCAGCEVRQQCLEYALTSGMPAGVWGGRSTTERDALIRTRHQAQRAAGGPR